MADAASLSMYYSSYTSSSLAASSSYKFCLPIYYLITQLPYISHSSLAHASHMAHSYYERDFQKAVSKNSHIAYIYIYRYLHNPTAWISLFDSLRGGGKNWTQMQYRYFIYYHNIILCMYLGMYNVCLSLKSSVLLM